MKRLEKLHNSILIITTLIQQLLVDKNIANKEIKPVSFISKIFENPFQINMYYSYNWLKSFRPS